MLTEIKELSDHMFWADGIVWNAVMVLPEKENHKKLKVLLHHIHAVQHAYLNIWFNQPIKYRAMTEFHNLNEIAEWGLDFHKKYEIFINKLNEEKLKEIIKIPWSKHLDAKLGKPAGPSSLTQQILQVVLHSTYHRAQVNKTIREIGVEPPLTDFIFWIWTGKPEGKWK
ncbi:MAG: hypothetical protein A2V93_00210 [Ignavibacteria bacterium RBG_16_34_14]|nr:MAG: hypothetical protein A2V93_00210 [Ignavibacteria bacterium RBG_16_34_14]